MTKQQLAYYSGFARGITEAISDNAFTNPSSMTARVYKRDGLEKELAKDLHCKEEDLILQPSALSLSDYLKLELGWDSENAWNLGRRLGFVMGKPDALFTLRDDGEIKDRYSGFSRGGGPFYFVEDLFIAFYGELAVLYIVGNDE
ncbi:MAG: hypothetical protein IKX89_05680 [Firmicutes bacterium]|nr:hypothetical protein [Bacillota bacterium]